MRDMVYAFSFRRKEEKLSFIGVLKSLSLYTESYCNKQFNATVFEGFKFLWTGFKRKTLRIDFVPQLLIANRN